MDHDHDMPGLHTEHAGGLDDDHDTLEHLVHIGARIILDKHHEHPVDVDDIVDHDELVQLVDLVGTAVFRVFHHHLHATTDDRACLVDDEPDDVDQLTADLIATIVHDLVEHIASIDDEPDTEHFPAPAGSEVTS